MPRISLQYKIGFLLFIAIAAVVSIGYLSYQSLSSIVSSINVKTKPDYTVITLKDIALELEKAENSIRVFTLSKDEKNLKPYYEVIFIIDKKLKTLRTDNPDNPELLARIDTINWLIEERYVLWSRMIMLHETDSTHGKLESLSQELLKIDTLSKNQKKETMFEKLFRTNTIEEPIVNHRELAEKINIVEVQGQQRNIMLKNEELKLSRTNQKITARFYALIQELEKAEKEATESKALKADILARQTYQWLAFFMIAVTLLAVIVVLLVARFTKKTIATQHMLEHSKQEAERLAKIKELFTANVSHEIRTPLNAIYGFLEQVELNSLDEENREKLKVIKTASKNLLRIVVDVLDFSKLQSGKLILENRHYTIRSVVDDVFLLFNESAVKNNSVLQLHVDPDVTEAYFGDPFRLKQILNNLVGNAIKFTRNGTIGIDVYEEYKSRKGANLVIRISDTGIGIASEKLESIFDDYTQGEAGTTQKYGGTGLGLSIVKKIIELFGGTITVESRLNAGSTFTCHLQQAIGDVELVHTEETSGAIIAPPELQNFNLLIADDEPYNRLLLKMILKKWKMPFEEAADGLNAIDKIKSERFQLAILDIQMPGINGIKAAKFVRDVLKKSKVDFPLVALTAAYSTEECKVYKEGGFNEVIRKPFSETELLRVIVSLLKLSTNTPLEIVPAAIMEKATGNLNLRELYRISNNDESFVKEMLETFVKTYYQGLEQIDEKLEVQEYHEIAEVAHKICSPCRHLGADELGRLTKKLESECRKSSPKNNISKLVDDLKSEFFRVESQINNKFAENQLLTNS
jgi:signal transduction histidine kinase/CheY-like chemotaxis protein/HPt (histidine-containing phosphotransfer) domain-containing protein